MVDITGSGARVARSATVRLSVRLSLSCAGLAIVAGCAGGAQQARTVGYYEAHAHHGYNPPGPPSDPWGPYIKEASARFDVPAQWIRQVMRVESGGHEYINGKLTVSSVGAMGLMQLMPATYQEIAEQNGLGSDPFNPYDNIMAGTAYIHSMYQIYGSPGFLAAYDAGPGRLNSYMNGGHALPSETVNYVAMIAPHIQGYYPSQRSEADQLALNTLPRSRAPGILPPGFDPNAPPPASAGASSGVVELAANTQTAKTVAPAIYTSSSVVVGSATLPPPPALPKPVQSSMVASVLATPQIVPLPPPPPSAPSKQRNFSVIPVAMADTPPLPVKPAPMKSAPVKPAAASYAAQSPHHSGWAIQVGAYDTSSHAKAALGIAELSAVQMLMGAHPMVISVQADGHTKYRARFVGLVREDAVNACNRLASGPTGCMVVPPEAQS